MGSMGSTEPIIFFGTHKLKFLMTPLFLVVESIWASGGDTAEWQLKMYLGVVSVFFLLNDLKFL